MNTHVILITAKTNIHVGSENGGEFTIIDKAIQKDPLTKLPCINSSSLKGAINEYCCHHGMKPEDRSKLFGSDKIGEKDNFQKGEAIFFDAKLLYLPQQDDMALYHYTTSDEVIRMMVERVKLFVPSFKFEKTNHNGKEIVRVKNNEMVELCSDDNLPIIARNTLENGESKNLWYEQILPAETVFYTIISEDGNKLKDALDGKTVQIGANATIGYGYCEFKFI